MNIIIARDSLKSRIPYEVVYEKIEFTESQIDALAKAIIEILNN